MYFKCSKESGKIPLHTQQLYNIVYRNLKTHFLVLWFLSTTFKQQRHQRAPTDSIATVLPHKIEVFICENKQPQHTRIEEQEGKFCWQSSKGNVVCVCVCRGGWGHELRVAVWDMNKLPQISQSGNISNVAVYNHIACGTGYVNVLRSEKNW